MCLLSWMQITFLSVSRFPSIMTFVHVKADGNIKTTVRGTPTLFETSTYNTNITTSPATHHHKTTCCHMTEIPYLRSRDNQLNHLHDN